MEPRYDKQIEFKQWTANNQFPWSEKSLKANKDLRNFYKICGAQKQFYLLSILKP